MCGRIGSSGWLRPDMDDGRYRRQRAVAECKSADEVQLWMEYSSRERMYEEDDNGAGLIYKR